jgi:GNAT superfamily N-acetyltransferase
MAIQAGRSDAEPARSLLDAFTAELRQRYEGLNWGNSPSATADEMAPPAGAFLLVALDGNPVACGGVKRLDPETAEIKRMFVAPAARGRGVARRLLAALEAAARELGYATVRLDTGAAQPDARHVYATSGYRPIPDYNGNPYAAFWFEKAL